MTDITDMSSWIAPPLAAEYLNVSEDDLWQRIRDGKLPTCQVGGFLFVDINPDAPAAVTTPQIAKFEDDSADVAPDRAWTLLRRQASQRRQQPRKAA